jgi:hypothetical protein
MSAPRTEDRVMRPSMLTSEEWTRRCRYAELHGDVAESAAGLLSRTLRRR